MEKAISQFEHALHYDNHDHDARLHLALSLIALSRYVQAIKELLKVVKTDPSHQQAWFNLGLSYQEQGFLDEAVNAFSKAISLNGNDLDVHLSLASLLYRLQRIKEAKSLIKRAMKLNPKKTEEFIASDEWLCHESRLINKRN